MEEVLFYLKKNKKPPAEYYYTIDIFVCLFCGFKLKEPKAALIVAQRGARVDQS